MMFYLRYELTLQNAQRALAALLEQPVTPWVPFAAARRSKFSCALKRKCEENQVKI